MKENKDIDRLFQEKFKDFEASPSPELWGKIKEELQPKKRRVFLLPVWYKLGGVAALIALILGLSGVFTPTESKLPIENSVTHQEAEEQNKKAKEEAVEEKGFMKEIEANELTKEAQTTSVAIVNTKNKTEEEKKILKEDTPEKKRVHQKPTGKTKNQNTQASLIAANHENTTGKRAKAQNTKQATEEINQEASSLDIAFESSQKSEQTHSSQKVNDTQTEEKAIAEQTLPKKSLLEEIKKQKEKEEILDGLDEQFSSSKRWAVQPTLTPVYYEGNKAGKILDPGISDNPSKSEVTMAYGVQIAYAVSDKVKLRTGVNKVQMNYSTQDVLFAPDGRGVSLKNINTHPSTQNISLYNAKNLPKHEGTEGVALSAVAPSFYGLAEVSQQYGYLEIPLEISYTLLDKRFGIEVIGGASTMFVQKNEVHLQTLVGNTTLGKADNLNDVSFSTNVGLGFGYKITQNLGLSVEPTFKYQLNAFSGSASDYNPYYFGVYTGLEFRF